MFSLTKVTRGNQKAPRTKLSDISYAERKYEVYGWKTVVLPNKVLLRVVFKPSDLACKC